MDKYSNLSVVFRITEGETENQQGTYWIDQKQQEEKGQTIWNRKHTKLLEKK